MQYLVPNHAKNTTAAPNAVTTGTAIKTMLQIDPIVPLYVCEWGYFFDGSPSDIKVELIEVDVAATVTALADADITKLDCVADGVASTVNMTLGTSATGFTASAEGTVTVVRNLDAPQVSSLKAFKMPFALGQRPIIQIGKFARIRVTAAAAVNMLCYMKVSPSDK
ncbi:MAG: hypothetical protein ACREQ5_03425 [Candidatus Dormibacteria bacterium]